MVKNKISLPKEEYQKDPAAEKAGKSVKVNGFQQIVDMLRVADPAFRESLIRRIAAKDRGLAESLVKDLTQLGLDD